MIALYFETPNHSYAQLMGVFLTESAFDAESVRMEELARKDRFVITTNHDYEFKEPETFAGQTLKAFGDKFMFVKMTLEEPDNGHSEQSDALNELYQFVYQPLNLEVHVIVTDDAYEVALVDADGSYIDSDHVRHHADISELFSRLLADLKFETII